MRRSGEKGFYAGGRKGVEIDPKVQQFLLCFKNDAFRFKISPENMFLNYYKVCCCVHR